MRDFNRDDHIIVTIAETGKKKFFLKAHVISVGAVNGRDNEGPSRFVMRNDDPDGAPVEYIVAESAHEIVDLLNGAPDANTREEMANVVLRERHEEAVLSLAHLERMLRQPDMLIETLQTQAHNAYMDMMQRAPQVAANDAAKRASLRFRLVDRMYRSERENIHATPDDSLFLKVMGVGILDQVKDGVSENKAFGRAQDQHKHYTDAAARQQRERQTLYSREKEHLERLRDDPSMNTDDRIRLNGMIRDYREAHGPAPEFRFIRDDKTQSFRPQGEVQQERAKEQERHQEQHRLDRAMDLARRAHRSLHRTRTRERDFGYER